MKFGTNQNSPWATENTHEPVSTGLAPKKNVFYLPIYACGNVTPMKSYDYFRNNLNELGRSLKYFTLLFLL